MYSFSPTKRKQSDDKNKNIGSNNIVQKKKKNNDHTTGRLSFGNLKLFEENTDDWESYTQQFELFAKCNSIVENHM